MKRKTRTTKWKQIAPGVHERMVGKLREKRIARWRMMEMMMEIMPPILDDLRSAERLRHLGRLH